MATPTFIGATTATIIPQSDFQATGSETGKFDASQGFKVRREFLDTFSLSTYFAEGKRATELDSNLASFWSFLFLTHFDVGNEDGGWTLITARYVGRYQNEEQSDVESGPVPVYSLNGTVEEASILEHPKVAALSGQIRAYLNALLDGTAVLDFATNKPATQTDEGEIVPWDVSAFTGDGLTFAQKIAAGVTTYKRPSFNWTEQIEGTTQFSASDLNSLGYISTPAGSPPTPSGSRDWMLYDAQSTQTGITNPVYSKSRTWLLSDRGGHDSDLYSA